MNIIGWKPKTDDYRIFRCYIIMTLNCDEILSHYRELEWSIIRHRVRYLHIPFYHLKSLAFILQLMSKMQGKKKNRNENT